MGCCPSWILQPSGRLSVLPSLLGLRGSGQHRDFCRVAYVPLSFMEGSPVEQWLSQFSKSDHLPPSQAVDTTSVNLLLLLGPTFWQCCGGGDRASWGSLNNVEFSAVQALFSSSQWSCLLTAGPPLLLSFKVTVFGYSTSPHLLCVPSEFWHFISTANTLHLYGVLLRH